MITYKQAGVNVKKGNELVKRIQAFAPKIGGFSAGIPLPKSFKEPILVGCTDGVGTKLAIAQALGQHNGIGHDLVGMNVNDLICSGAKPLFFLDYFACGKLNIGIVEKVVKGIARACRESDCHLIGGETAEMPGFYKPGEYDLAGFATGVVEKSKILKPKETIRPGDILLGLPSSGLHANGFSLVRKIFKKTEWRRKAKLLLSPTRLYVKDVMRLLKKLNSKSNQGIKGIVHVTGGGFTDNIPRILPHHLRATIEVGHWPIPPLFREIQTRGRLSQKEMFKTFNMGIGLILIGPPTIMQKANRMISPSYFIGRIERGSKGVSYE